MSMKRLVALLLLTCMVPAAAQAGPTMEELVLSPADYTGTYWLYRGVTLSGAIMTYDVAGVRKYYLTVGSRAGTIEPGFFLAPPRVADQLYAKMNRQRNYTVNLTCRVRQIVIKAFHSGTRSSRALGSSARMGRSSTR